MSKMSHTHTQKLTQFYKLAFFMLCFFFTHATFAHNGKHCCGHSGHSNQPHSSQPHNSEHDEHHESQLISAQDLSVFLRNVIKTLEAPVMQSQQETDLMNYFSLRDTAINPTQLVFTQRIAKALLETEKELYSACSIHSDDSSESCKSTKNKVIRTLIQIPLFIYEQLISIFTKDFWVINIGGTFPRIYARYGIATPPILASWIISTVSFEFIEHGLAFMPPKLGCSLFQIVFFKSIQNIMDTVKLFFSQSFGELALITSKPKNWAGLGQRYGRLVRNLATGLAFSRLSNKAYSYNKTITPDSKNNTPFDEFLTKLGAWPIVHLKNTIKNSQTIQITKLTKLQNSQTSQTYSVFQDSFDKLFTNKDVGEFEVRLQLNWLTLILESLTQNIDALYQERKVTAKEYWKLNRLASSIAGPLDIYRASILSIISSSRRFYISPAVASKLKGFPNQIIHTLNDLAELIHTGFYTEEKSNWKIKAERISEQVTSLRMEMESLSLFGTIKKKWKQFKNFGLHQKQKLCELLLEFSKY